MYCNQSCLFVGVCVCVPSITEWEMYITAQGHRLQNDLCCVEWDVKLYYTIQFNFRCVSGNIFSDIALNYTIEYFLY